ncbi:MAG: cysteinyl-tRNA synthetase [Actinomycetota bacterium]|jgi:cysteinyl-tRNA synthetase|nr:cysteinyl-tRNA synthetase [Actinomycetota bacterium]
MHLTVSWAAMRLYNSLTRRVEEVVPAEPGHVKMYSCGPTVYRYAHLGNLRTFMLGDLVRRVLELEGLRVTQIMNITDVGHMTDESSPEAVDKMLLAMEDEGLSPLEIAQKYTTAVFEDAAALGIRPADGYPKATEHVPEMVEMTSTLIENGHAYLADSGSVYYDVTSFPGYGKLSGNTLDNLREGHRDLETDPQKRHAADFALWKHAGSGRVMKWPSPWGEGFPGWHIECSAMSMKYLGDRVDIHTGATDLRFPHHEDEIAQSEGVAGHQVVSIWLHGGHLRQSGRKISKSTGNVVRVQELREHGFDPLSFRWLTFQTQYRSEMDFSWDAMEDADKRVKQLRRRMAAWGPAAEELGPAARAFDLRFRAALANDLHLPGAVVVVNDLDRDTTVSPNEKYALLAAWDVVLGLDLEREARSDWAPTAEMAALMTARDTAREAKDFATSDRIRDELSTLGLEVMDTAEGTTVRPRD